MVAPKPQKKKRHTVAKNVGLRYMWEMKHIISGAVKSTSVQIVVGWLRLKLLSRMTTRIICKTSMSLNGMRHKLERG